MITREDYKRELLILRQEYDDEPYFIDLFEDLIQEYFELVEENRKLKIALDNAIKECCINVNGSDTCSSLDELYKSFEKKVWKDVG